MGSRALPAGHAMTWQDGRLRIWRWYDLAEQVGPELDSRPAEVVQEEYLALMADSVRLRFRSDVPVGINLSGGLDSSILLGLVQAVQGRDSEVKAFTFTTGDPEYDELPWVQQMLARTRHPLEVCPLRSGGRAGTCVFGSVPPGRAVWRSANARLCLCFRRGAPARRDRAARWPGAR